MGRMVVARARGHVAIRATHANTLELTRDTEITPRATCVVGVAADIPPEVALLRGRVHVTVEAGGRTVSGEAVINPRHQVADRIVVRRSDWSDVDTLAISSTLTAKDCDPGLVATLANPDSVVTLTVREVEPAPPLVVLAVDGDVGGGRLARLAAATDSTVDLERIGRDRTAAGEVAVGATVIARLPEPTTPTSASVAAWFTAAAARGARFAAAAPAWPAPVLAAAGQPLAPALWLGAVDKRAVRDATVVDLLTAAPVPVVVVVPPDDAATVLALVAAAKPDHRIAVDDGVVDVGVAVDWYPASEAAGAVSGRAGPVPIVIPPRSRGSRRLDLEAVVRALTAAGVAPRTVSEALAPLGVSRRQVYDAIGTDAPRDRSS